jgi:nitroreductase
VSWFWRNKKHAPSAESAPRDGPSSVAVLRAYHRATVHHAQRFAHGPGELDWETQPDPFRRYAGAEPIELELVEPTDEPRYEPSFHALEVPAARLDRRSLAQLFFDSLALTACKRWGDSKWWLRCNPSSGNLHPTEGWIVCGALAGVSDTPFVAHYAPHAHVLEVRARLTPEQWSALELPSDAFLVALTSIPWREAWKYGERAFRYCQLDVGHAIGALAVAAAGLGWRTHVLDDVSSDELSALLGIHSQRGPFAELPEALIAVLPASRTAPAGSAPWRPRSPSGAALRAAAQGGRAGAPNDLSTGWMDWPAVDAAAEAASKPRTLGAHELDRAPRLEAQTPEREPLALRRIVRGRRSAVSLDGRTGMTRDALWQTLARTIPRTAAVVLDVAPFDPLVDLVVFVHRVQDVESGLYLCLRDPRREERWRAASALARDAPVVDADGLRVLQLRGGDFRSHARAVSCHQDIASDGCFALAMLADFAGPLERTGAWMYPRLHWECGWIGQLLYLEAEALGLRATGIGCFFDDALHSLLGLAGEDFRSLYHFTLGGPVEDPRIQSEAPYAHLESERTPARADRSAPPALPQPGLPMR